MRNLIIVAFVFCLAETTIAQDFPIFKHQGDSLRRKGKYKKAAVLYNEAFDRLASYQEKVTDEDWAQLGFAIRDVSLKISKKKDPGLITVKYGNNGDVIKDKIALLKKLGTKCVFTYYITAGGTIWLPTTSDPVTNAQVWMGSSNDQKLLVWAENGNVFLQCFSVLNIYPPVKITDSQFADICLNHFDELINEKIKPCHYKGSEQRNIEIIIPVDNESRFVKKFYDGDVVAPIKPELLSEWKFLSQRSRKSFNDRYQQDSIIYLRNHKTYLARLIPLLQAEWTKNSWPAKH
jgi:hypothetical protein